MSKCVSMSRQEHLDSLRGVAALIVVVVHYCAAFYPHIIFGAQGGYQQHSSLESFFVFPPFGLFVAGHFSVCLFFILSGYVLSYSYLGESSKKYKILSSIVKRPIRLGGLLWASIIIGFLFWYFGLFYNSHAADLTSSEPWFSHYWSGDADYFTFVVNLMTSSFSNGSIYNPPLWTIKIELYGSILVYMFLLLLGGSKYRLVVSILLVVLCKDSLYQGFWIGVVIADISKNYNVFGDLRFKSIYSYILVVLFIYFSSYPNNLNQESLMSTPYFFLPDDKGFGGGYPMLSALLIFILTISSEPMKKFLNRPVFLFFGKISYGIYVFHFLIIGSLSSWVFLQLIGHIGYHYSFLIAFVTGVAAIVMIACITTRYVDNPSIKLAKYLGDKVIVSIDSIRRHKYFSLKK